MICPVCDDSHSRVYKTRKVNDVVLRRRVCVACNHRWITREVFVRSARQWTGRKQVVRNYSYENTTPITPSVLIVNPKCKLWEKEPTGFATAFREALKEAGLE